MTLLYSFSSLFGFQQMTEGVAESDFVRWKASLLMHDLKKRDDDQGDHEVENKKRQDNEDDEDDSKKSESCEENNEWCNRV